VTISWDDRPQPTPPAVGGAPWTGAVPPTPPPAERLRARRRSGRAWLVMAALVVTLALVTAAYLVAAAS
jgi:hypothetical protein